MLNIKSILNKTRELLPKKISSKLPREIGVVLLKAQESAKLNMIYRNKNKASNMLSFYYGPEYGEILICPEIIKQEAVRQGNAQDFQMTWMIVHGMLHLAGIHHEKSLGEELRFLQIEKEVLVKLKV